jgi:hypothetical protein
MNGAIKANHIVISYAIVTGWWFGTWLLFSMIYGMLSFPLTSIFQDG